MSRTHAAINCDKEGAMMQLEKNQDSVQQEEPEQHTTTAAARQQAWCWVQSRPRARDNYTMTMRAYEGNECTHKSYPRVQHCNTKQCVKHAFHRTSSGRTLWWRLCHEWLQQKLFNSHPQEEPGKPHSTQFQQTWFVEHRPAAGTQYFKSWNIQKSDMNIIYVITYIYIYVYMVTPPWGWLWASSKSQVGLVPAAFRTQPFVTSVAIAAPFSAATCRELRKWFKTWKAIWIHRVPSVLFLFAPTLLHQDWFSHNRLDWFWMILHLLNLVYGRIRIVQCFWKLLLTLSWTLLSSASVLCAISASQPLCQENPLKCGNGMRSLWERGPTIGSHWRNP